MAAMACPSVPSLLPGPTSKVMLASEQTLMKWPNGLAATTELFVFPPRGSFETLQFVISVHLCKITDSCSYPYIAGATRLVGRLEGGPLILNHNNRADSHIMKPVRSIPPAFHRHKVFLCSSSCCSLRSSLFLPVLLVAGSGGLLAFDRSLTATAADFVLRVQGPLEHVLRGGPSRD
jgi:hypothetical protein